MTVLERSQLAASPLADLHAIADQVGIDGFRRLRKAELIDAILRSQGIEDEGGQPGAEEAGQAEREAEGAAAPTRRRRAPRARRARVSAREEGEEPEEEEGRGRREARGPAEAEQRVAEGVVEVLGNGSAFLRLHPPGASEEDVYISAAQVRRCELVSGDRVSGPVRTPRRSERYPSLVRIDTINGASAEAVAGAARFDEMPAAWPSERLALGSEDRTLEAIEWLAPLGLGSRAVICGARFAGKSETLRRIARALARREGLSVSVVLLGARPEEIADWQAEEGLEPAVALPFGSSADAQAQALEHALETARRVAARGGDAAVLIDSLDALQPHAARRALASARNLRDGGSLTVIACAAAPLGGETTVITLDVALTSTGHEPIIDLRHSCTLRAELLVGEDGARAITKARASAFEAA